MNALYVPVFLIYSLFYYIPSLAQTNEVFDELYDESVGEMLDTFEPPQVSKPMQVISKLGGSCVSYYLMAKLYAQKTFDYWKRAYNSAKIRMRDVARKVYKKYRMFGIA